MGLREIVISVLLGVFVVLVFTSFMNDTSNSYGTTVDNTTWQDDFVNITAVTTMTQQQSQLLEESGTDSDEFEPNVVSVTGTAKLFLQAKNFFQDMVSTVWGFLNVDDSEGNYFMLIMAVFGVIIIATVASFLWRFRL